MDDKPEVNNTLPKLSVKAFLSNLDNILGTLFAIAMVIFLILQVFSRFIFNYPLTWTEELAVVFFIVSSYFGVSASIPRNQQIRINIITEFLNPKGKKGLALVANFFTVIFAVVIIYGLYFVIENQYASKGVLAITRFPKYLIYAVLPFCFLLFIIRIVIQSVQIIKGTKKEGEVSVKGASETEPKGGED